MIPSQVGTDDFFIALHIRSEGFRVVADLRARYAEKRPKTFSEVVTQKVKNIAGGTREMVRFRQFFGNPRYGVYGLLIFPTKLLHTQLNPIVLGFAFCSGLVLGLIWLGILGMSAVAAGIFLVGAAMNLYKQGILLSPLWAFLISEWIILKGLMLYLRGGYTPLWNQARSTRE